MLSSLAILAGFILALYIDTIMFFVTVLISVRFLGMVTKSNVKTLTDELEKRNKAENKEQGLMDHMPKFDPMIFMAGNFGALCICL